MEKLWDGLGFLTSWGKHMIQGIVNKLIESIYKGFLVLLFSANSLKQLRRLCFSGDMVPGTVVICLAHLS